MSAEYKRYDDQDDELYRHVWGINLDRDAGKQPSDHYIVQVMNDLHHRLCIADAHIKRLEDDIERNH